MPRPDPKLLDPARYPFSCSIETRFGDVDLNRHINNVALVGLLEEGRVRFHSASGYISALGDTTSMVASLAVEFLGQSYFPAPIELHVAPSRLGRTSYKLNELVTQEGRLVAYAEAVMVRVGAEGPVELPASFRDTIDQWLLRA